MELLLFWKTGHKGVVVAPGGLTVIVDTAVEIYQSSVLAYFKTLFYPPTLILATYTIPTYMAPCQILFSTNYIIYWRLLGQIVE